MTYSALLAADVSAYVTIEIEADSPAEAIEKAKHLAIAEPFDVDWSTIGGFRIVQMTDEAMQQEIEEAESLEFELPDR